jgi:iron complex transport system ATP-binding protein
MIDTSELEAENLAIGYHSRGTEQILLEDLNCQLRGGDLVCLMGPNGAGKSTLIRTLAGMQEPLGGCVRIGGRPLRELSPRQRARAISVVLTEGLPPSLMTTASMVALGRHPFSGWWGRLTATDHERISWALETVDATTLAHRQVAELSDGERQRVAIARALAQEASLMLLDEPTAYLDLPRRVELISILRRITRQTNMALLLSTHDLDLAMRFADRLWLVTAEGQLHQGIPETLAMEGQLEATFSSPTFRWNAETGTFSNNLESCVQVRLEGSGNAYEWTRRALGRIGYALAEPGGSADLHIELGAEWTVRVNGQQHRFLTLESMIDWLRRMPPVA